MKNRFEVDAPVFGELHLVETDLDELGKNMPRATSDRRQCAVAPQRLIKDVDGSSFYSSSGIACTSTTAAHACSWRCRDPNEQSVTSNSKSASLWSEHELLVGSIAVGAVRSSYL